MEIKQELISKNKKVFCEFIQVAAEKPDGF